MTSNTAGANTLGGAQYSRDRAYDTTGQIAPPGMKPRVTATLWEDEGSLCFQVEAKGICVARREGMKELPSLRICGLFVRSSVYTDNNVF